MPISKNQIRNYYFGLGVESYIMSQLQMLNCQVTKLNPDFGFDLHTTNLAATQYLGAQKVDHYIQVKSRIYYSENKYQFRICKSDFNLIESTPNALVVFVVAKPQIYGDPLSFEEDREMMLYLDQQLETSAINHFFYQSPNKVRSIAGYSEFADKVKGFKGHLIINSGTYAWIDIDKQGDAVAKNNQKIKDYKKDYYQAY